jgi:hypothetical protein
MRIRAQRKYAPLALEGDRTLAVLSGGRRRVRSPRLDPKFAGDESTAGRTLL